MNSAAETAAAVEEIEMSELRAGEETGMERGESESLLLYWQITRTTQLYLGLVKYSTALHVRDEVA